MMDLIRDRLGFYCNSSNFITTADNYDIDLFKKQHTYQQFKISQQLIQLNTFE